MSASQRPNISGLCWLVVMSLVAVLARSKGARAFTRHHLPPTIIATHQGRLFASVTGSVYEADGDNVPRVTLFTKEGCTLCDKVKDVLKDLREEIPHSLDQVDITDDDHKEWFDKYKYDIPILHVNGQYWLKHRTNIEEARAGLEEAQTGSFQARSGEPNAAAMERK
jgi:glutaredoxin